MERSRHGSGFPFTILVAGTRVPVSLFSARIFRRFLLSCGVFFTISFWNRVIFFSPFALRMTRESKRRDLGAAATTVMLIRAILVGAFERSLLCNLLLQYAKTPWQ